MLRGFRFGNYACVLAAAVALASSSHAQPLIRQGAEFQVNVYTTGHQRSPGVALDSDGDFVVVWTSANQDGVSYGVFGRRYDSAGAPQGTEFQIGTYTGGTEFSPEVALRAGGDFVLVWANSTEGAGLSGIVGRRFDSSGEAQGGEFHVNTFTVSYQNFPDIAASADGFVVVWTSGGQDDSYTGVFGRVLDENGVAQSGEFQVNTYTSGYQNGGYVAAGALGDFVVVWSSSDGNGPGVFGRRFDSTGAPLTDEFQVNSYTTGYQIVARVASNGAGDFVVVWQSPQDGASYGVFGRRFDSTGMALDGEFQVNTVTTGTQWSADVDFDDDGGFAVTWSSVGQDGAQGGIFAKRYDAAGTVLAFEFQVNSRTASEQSDPRIAAARESGQFVIAWASLDHDGSQNGIFGHRLRPPVDLDIDADGTARPLSDGMLVLRGGFEITGPALIAGVLGPSCVMCSAEHIEAYLAEISLLLDVDDNGLFEGEFDGVLVIRYLFGFRGAVLIEGAVANPCGRCLAPDIEEYLEDRITP